MSFSSLPPEVLAFIIGKLDEKSLYNLHEADVLSLEGLVTECRFTANSLATAKTLKSNFFLTVSPYIRVLNLCGVKDLLLPALLDALSPMDNLTDLNVIYTSVMTHNLREIIKARPTLKSLDINFLFMDEFMAQMNDEILLEFQKALEGLENVHFLGPIRTGPMSALAVRLLERADLKTLKLTSPGSNHATHLDRQSFSNMKMLRVSQIQVYFLQTFHSYSVFKPAIHTVMDFSKYEILIIHANSDSDPVRKYKVLATTLLKKIISENFAVNIECLSDWAEVSTSTIQKRIRPSTVREVTFMYWDKDRTSFNAEFTKKVLSIFKKHYVFSLASDDESIVPAEFNWYSVQQKTPSDFNKPSNSIVELDYGKAFKEKNDVKLDVMFSYSLKGATPRMINNWGFMSKISHLFFYGRGLIFDLLFFDNLFESCPSLVTLQVVNMGGNSFESEYLQYLHKCKKLKNIMILFSGLKLFDLFPYLSECTTLENICLNDFTFRKPVDIDTIPDPTELFRKCVNLYNILITFEMSLSNSAILEEKYKKVRSELGLDALRIRICYLKYGYTHPYMGVFSTYQLKPM